MMSAQTPNDVSAKPKWCIFAPLKNDVMFARESMCEAHIISAATSLRSNIICKKQTSLKKDLPMQVFFHGGDDGSRTHVQNQIPKGSTGVVCYLWFPSPSGSKQPIGYGSPCYLTGIGTLPCSCSPLSRRPYISRGGLMQDERRLRSL